MRRGFVDQGVVGQRRDDRKPQDMPGGRDAQQGGRDKRDATHPFAVVAEVGRRLRSRAEEYGAAAAGAPLPNPL